MPSYVKSIGDIEFGGGDLKINKTDSTYSDADSAKFVTLGGTDKDAGGVLKIGEKQIVQVFTENDREEPAKEWVDGQEVTFEVVLAETSLENFVIAMGEDPAEIVDYSTASPKYKAFRGYTKRLPKHFPFIYEVPQSANSNLKDVLIMPSCEIVGAQDFAMKDDEPRQLHLTLKLHKVATILGTNLILNGSFETTGVSPQPFASWTKTEAGTSTVTAFTGSVNQPVDGSGNRIEPIHTGLRSCKLMTDGSTNEASVSQTITTVNNKVYLVEFWHLSTSQLKQLKLSIAAMDYTLLTRQDANTYGRYGVILMATGTSYAIKIRLMSASSTVYIDDVTVTCLSDLGTDSTALAGRKFEFRRQYA